MGEYQIGHVKHDPATQQVAIRTQHDNSTMRWVVATSSVGARNAPDEDVELWDDLYTPPEAT